MYEEDIRTSFKKEVDVEGRIFVLKYQNGEEKDIMTDKISQIETDDKGKITKIFYRVVDRNKYWFGTCVHKVPYDFKNEVFVESLKGTLTDIEWQEVNTKQDWSKFKPKIRAKIINALPNNLREKVLIELVEMNLAMNIKKK